MVAFYPHETPRSGGDSGVVCAGSAAVALRGFVDRYKSETIEAGNYKYLIVNRGAEPIIGAVGSSLS